MKGKKRRDAQEKRLTCLITGFEPFAGDEINPTEELLRVLPERLYFSAGHSSEGKTPSADERPKTRIKLRKQLLPVSGKAGWDSLKKAIDDSLAQGDGPIVLIMTGLAAGRDRLNLERFALNVRDYSIADNSGAQVLDSFVDPAEPDLLRTMVELPPLARTMNKAGYPCAVSNHAGTFICNELYFKALTYCRLQSRIKAVLFMHVPTLESLTASCGTSTSKVVARRALAATEPVKQLRLLKEATTTLIKAASQLLDKPVPISAVNFN